MFYKPEQLKSVAADVIPFYEDGVYYLFYLQDDRDLEHVGEGCDWRLITTTDFINYVNHGIVLKRGTINDQDLYVYTGCVFKEKDTYYIFYTGHNPHFEKDNKGAQKVLLATSKDLLNWKKQPNFVFGPNDNKLEINDFRDPFVFKEKDHYSMIITARYKDVPLLQMKGTLLKAVSKDLLHWELEEKPFYNPQSYYAHECPDVFKIGEWYYLIFSEFSDRFVTTYRMAKSLDAPWISPKNNTFDGHAFYAAKTAFDGKRRILFGWNPTKEGNDDNRYWQWGGAIVPQEIYQEEDGTLAVRCLTEIRNSYTKDLQLDIKPILGDVVFRADDIILNGTEKRTIVSLGKLEANVKIELDVKPHTNSGDFGIYLNEKDNFEYYYLARFDALYSRLMFDKWPRFDRTKYGHIDTERPSSIKTKEYNHIIVIVQDSILEVYVNDKIVMSARMYEKGESFGFYAMNVDVSIKNISYKGKSYE